MPIYLYSEILRDDGCSDKREYEFSAHATFLPQF